MHQSVGKGSSVSLAAVEYCGRNDISVIAGACPMMYGEGRRLRTHVHAVDPQTHRRPADMKRRQIAWILILIVDVAYVAWGAMAAVMPDGLAGPGGKAILPAGYEGYSGAHGRSFCARLQ
jgi:hypothetical protein